MMFIILNDKYYRVKNDDTHHLTWYRRKTISDSDFFTLYDRMYPNGYIRLERINNIYT